MIKQIEVEVLFPRNLYKSPGNLKWQNKEHKKTYATVLVENESEYEEAVEAGYVDDFQEALFGGKDKPKSKLLKEDPSEKKGLFGRKKDDDDDF